MADLDLLVRSLLLFVATTVLEARRSRRWTQRRLARESGVSQSLISELERAVLPDLPMATAVRVLRALEIPFDLRLVSPRVTPSIRDVAHARCVAFVARKLEGAGWLVQTEVPIGGPGWHGWIDVLAYHPGTHILLAIEVKTEILDLGELERQIGRSEHSAWEAARSFGWRPRSVTGALVVLATAVNDRRLATERRWFDRTFSLRHGDLWSLVSGPATPPRRALRGLAMVDPRSRRKQWLLPTWIDGRRTPAPYADQAGFLAGQRRNARAA